MFTTDNRYTVGPGTVPEEAYVAYGARWIDRGDLMSADIVPDRQGFAYHNQADMVPLIEQLQFCDAENRHRELNFDVVETIFDGTEPFTFGDQEFGFGLVMRRCGGYVWVSSWLVPA